MSVDSTSRPNLGQILERLHLVTPDQVQAALDHQEKTGRLFGECLIELGFTGEDDVSWALSSQLGLPFMNVESSMADPELVSQYPRDFLRRNLVLPLVASEDELSVVLADPTDEVTLARLRRISARKLNVAVGTSTALRAALEELLGPVHPEESASQATAVDTGNDDTLGLPSLASPELTRLLDRAMSEGASAVFLDPEERTIRVRLRVGGSLQEGGTFEPKAMKAFVEALDGWLGTPETPVSGVRWWGGSALAVAHGSMQAVAVSGRDGTSVTLILDATGTDTERVSASFEPEWERLDQLLLRTHGLLVGTAPSPAERGRLLTRMLGQLDVSKRRGWVLAPPELTLPRHLACFGEDPDTVAETFATMDGIGVLAGMFSSPRSLAVLTRAAATDRLVIAVFPGNSALGFVAEAREQGILPSRLAESLLAVVAQRTLPGPNPDVPARSVAELLFVDSPFRRALQDGAQVSALRAAAREQGFVEIATRARTLDAVDPLTLQDLDRHRYLEEAA